MMNGGSYNESFYLGGEPSCRLKGKDRAGGLAVNKCRSACFINQGLEIFDLALDGIWRRVFTIASAPAIEAEHGEAWRQKLDEWRPPRSIAQSAVDQDQRRSVA